MNNNLIFRRLIQLGALFLIGDGVMGLLKPRWHSLLWHFDPELARAAMTDFYNNAIGHWVVVTIAIALLLFVVLTATVDPARISRVRGT